MEVLATVLSALVGGPRQHERLLRLHTPLGPEVLVAETLDGVESVDGGGFRLELTALSVDAHLDLAALLGQPVLLQLLTDGAGDVPRHAASAAALRPLHGHVTAFERVGSNGGLARYRLLIEPWLAFLRQRLDSYVFQDMTVVEIVESVFADWVGTGKLAPAWRWQLQDPAVYPKRSLTTQYQESDFAFVERLLAEEGIAYWFEHEGDPVGDGFSRSAGGSSFGTHTLVLGDHPEAFADIGAVRHHRSDASEHRDGIHTWSLARRWQPLRLRRASWDYKTLDVRATEVEGDVRGAVAALDDDTAGPYAWPDRATGERYARQQLEALQVGSATGHGGGTWRQLRAGARFRLVEGVLDAAAGFTCLRLRHRARNNLGAEVLAQVEQALGLAGYAAPLLPGALAEAVGCVPAGFGARAAAHTHGARVALAGQTRIGGEAGDALDTNTRQAGGAPGAYIYQNAFDVLPATTPYRPLTVDGHGARRHSRPSVHGTQVATVVSDGAPLLTERDHRIKVQFPWQRGGDAGNRLDHPSGEANAPGTDAAWTWVRVAGPWAGDNWGSVLLPRKGQEVLVAFLEGDIDRPVVIGAMYNGQGQPDAAHNQIAAGAAGATGNAPAWFDGNEHPAVFTGLKSQQLADSQGGSGGYQQLRLDDTPGQGRVQADTTQSASALTLGHLKGGGDNLRGNERGFGAELATQASGALRAGAGLLLTTERGRGQLDADGALEQLAQGEQLVARLAEAARAQAGGLPDEPAELHARKALQTTQAALRTTQHGRAPGDGIGGGDGEAAGWESPLIVASSLDGITSVTPAGQVWVSGAQTTLTAGQDLQWLSQGEAVLATAGGVVLYAHGNEPPSGKPNQEQGIALHAAQGAVSARAHEALARIAAQTSVTVASTGADVSVAAAKHVLVTAAGAYLRMEGGDIELGAPGSIAFKAAKKEWTGPKSDSADLPELPKTAGSFVKSFAVYALEGAGLDGAEITLFDPEKREMLWSALVPASGEVTAEIRDKSQGYIALAGYDEWSYGFDDLEESDDDTEDHDLDSLSDEDDREEEARMMMGGHDVD